LPLFEQLLFNLENNNPSEPIKTFNDSFTAMVYNKPPNADSELLLISENYLGYARSYAITTITIPRNEAIELLKDLITKLTQN